jgi:hypothetical protein
MVIFCLYHCGILWHWESKGYSEKCGGEMAELPKGAKADRSTKNGKAGKNSKEEVKLLSLKVQKRDQTW